MTNPVSLAILLSMAPSWAAVHGRAAAYVPAAPFAGIAVVSTLTPAVSPALAKTALPSWPAAPALAAAPALSAYASPALPAAVSVSVPVFASPSLPATSVPAAPSGAGSVSPAETLQGVAGLDAALAGAAADAAQKALGTLDAPGARVDAQAASLGGLFDGSAPILGGVGAGFDAQTFASAYGLHAWLSAIPEVAAAADTELAKARMLIALEPLLAKGPVIVMRDASGLTALAADDPSLPPVLLPLSADQVSSPEASPQARRLAGLLEAAALRDQAQPGSFAVAEVLNRLSSIATAEPVPEKPAPKLEPVEDVPLDPVRQPQEYLGRMLRDAVRAQEPAEALEILAKAREEAKRLLNYQDRARFLGRLRSHGELLAGQFVPGILEKLQLAAADNDKKAVEELVKTALAFVEYAPNWKPRVVKARQAALDTIEVLDRFGPVDPATGLPVPKEEPAQEAAPATAGRAPAPWSRPSPRSDAAAPRRPAS